MSSAEFLWTAEQNNNNGTSHEPVKVKVTEETIQYGPLVKPIVSVEIVDTSKIPTSWPIGSPQPIISMSLVDDSITSLDKFINEYVNASKDFYGGTFSRLPSNSSGGKRRSKKTKKSKRSKRKTQRRH